MLSQLISLFIGVVISVIEIPHIYLPHTGYNLNLISTDIMNLKLVNSFSEMPYCDIETDMILLHNKSI